jgi:hypothetical protein
MFSVRAQNTMPFNKNYDGNVSSERVGRIYTEQGMTINVDQAKQILEFMYMVAEIALEIAEEGLRKGKSVASNPNRFKSNRE